MATIKGVYEELKKMKRKGEDIGMFGESFIEMYEKDQEPSTTNQISVSFIKNKDREYPHWVMLRDLVILDHEKTFIKSCFKFYDDHKLTFRNN